MPTCRWLVGTESISEHVGIATGTRTEHASATSTVSGAHSPADHLCLHTHAHVPICSLLGHLDRRVSTARNATYPPEKAQTSPTIAVTEVPAGEIVSGDADGQEIAPTDAGLR